MCVLSYSSEGEEKVERGWMALGKLLITHPSDWISESPPLDRETDLVIVRFGLCDVLKKWQEKRNRYSLFHIPTVQLAAGLLDTLSLYFKTS